MNKHTPGPWSVEDPMGPESLWIVEANKQTYEWRCIAAVYGEDSFARHGIPACEQKANAALLSAAPDLLDALRDAYTYITQPQRMTLTEAVYPVANYNKLTASLRKAIAKAEGRP